MKLLPAIVLGSTKQAEKVVRLVKYCKELDGAQIQVIQLPKEIDDVPHPQGVELAVRYAGRLLAEPWLYLEADSIPVRPGWLEAISSEYYDQGKLFMLPSLEGLNPNDVASAIGVWPGNLHTYLPESCHGWPWFDYYIYLNRPGDIHLTKSIQHSYGIYEGNRVVRRHHFPRDRSLIRANTQIFHADPTQSLITGGERPTVYHSGDLGDIIAALPVIRKQGGGSLYLGPHHDGVDGRRPRVPITPGTFNTLRPLLEQQPYIHYCDYCDNASGADCDLSRFRLVDQLPGENLAKWQARSLGRADQDFDLEPWLCVDKVKDSDRVVVSRSLRYHNGAFPWRSVARKYRKRLVFVGTQQEHIRFQRLVNQEVEWVRTRTVLDLARVVAGARLQFSNQSLPWWLGAALGKTVIQETCLSELNSIIERPGLFYTRSAEETQAWAKEFL